MNKKLFILVAALSVLAAGCVKDVTESTGEQARHYLNLWMEANHPSVSQEASGIYILEDVPGTGALWSADYPYIYASTTIRTLNGTVSSTTDEVIAKQLGTYSVANYYGPKYQAVGEGLSYAGVDAVLSGMKQGGKRTAVIPAWMLTTSRFDTQDQYISACSSGSSLIYTISFEGQTKDIEEMEKALLADYVKANYGSLQPVSYVKDETADGTFYFISDTSSFKEDDAFGTDASVKLNYTGKLLSGKVFDTTLEKVAKDAGLYSDAKAYGPVVIKYSETYSDIKMGDSSNLIDGFKGGLSLMKWKGQKAVILLTSVKGYKDTGSGNSIPAYAPLIFELEILED